MSNGMAAATRSSRVLLISRKQAALRRPAGEPQRAVKQGAVSQPAAASTSRLPCICESVPAAQVRTWASSARKTPPFLKRSISARAGAKVLLSKMNWARAAFI